MNPPEKILSLDEIIRTKREVGHLKNQLDILELKQTDLANLKLLISTRIGEHKTFQNFLARWNFSKMILWDFECYFYLELEGLASKKTKETVEYKTARNRLTIVKEWVCDSLEPHMTTLCTTREGSFETIRDNPNKDSTGIYGKSYRRFEIENFEKWKIN